MSQQTTVDRRIQPHILGERSGEKLGRVKTLSVEDATAIPTARIVSYGTTFNLATLGVTAANRIAGITLYRPTPAAIGFNGVANDQSFEQNQPLDVLEGGNDLVAVRVDVDVDPTVPVKVVGTTGLISGGAPVAGEFGLPTWRFTESATAGSLVNVEVGSIKEVDIVVGA